MCNLLALSWGTRAAQIEVKGSGRLSKLTIRGRSYVQETSAGHVEGLVSNICCLSRKFKYGRFGKVKFLNEMEGLEISFPVFKNYKQMSLPLKKNGVIVAKLKYFKTNSSQIKAHVVSYDKKCEYVDVCASFAFALELSEW